MSAGAWRRPKHQAAVAACLAWLLQGVDLTLNFSSLGVQRRHLGLLSVTGWWFQICFYYIYIYTMVYIYICVCVLCLIMYYNTYLKRLFGMIQVDFLFLRVVSPPTRWWLGSFPRNHALKSPSTLWSWRAIFGRQGSFTRARLLRFLSQTSPRSWRSWDRQSHYCNWLRNTAGVIRSVFLDVFSVISLFLCLVGFPRGLCHRIAHPSAASNFHDTWDVAAFRSFSIHYQLGPIRQHLSAGHQATLGVLGVRRQVWRSQDTAEAGFDVMVFIGIEGEFAKPITEDTGCWELSLKPILGGSYMICNYIWYVIIYIIYIYIYFRTSVYIVNGSNKDHGLWISWIANHALWGYRSCCCCCCCWWWRWWRPLVPAVPLRGANFSESLLRIRGKRAARHRGVFET